jgi:hypothetical protein
MRKQERALAIGGCAIVLALTSGCAATTLESSAPDPGVPRISNLRVEPNEVQDGGQVALRFDFRDMDGDIVDIYLGVSAEIKDFTLATGLGPAVISRNGYLGLREGTAEEIIRVTMGPAPGPLTMGDFDGSGAEPGIRQQAVGGIRIYEVFVVDGRGQVSNRLRAQVTVTPSSQGPEPSARLHSGVVLEASTEGR